MKRQRGIVLLLAMVFSLLLGMLAASALRDALLETRMAGHLRDGLQAFEQAEATLLQGLAQLQHAPPRVCQPCLPPPRPHDLHGQWQHTQSGFFQVQNLGQSTRAAHLPEGERVTLFRVTAVSRQTQARQVLEAVYAQPAAQVQVPQRILWRQRLREH
ncbi:pilus assembly PilX family protein [Pseudomonas putida]